MKSSGIQTTQVGKVLPLSGNNRILYLSNERAVLSLRPNKITHKKILAGNQSVVSDYRYLCENKEKKTSMKILYTLYQICFALPVLLVLTILTALVTIIGSLLGNAHTWGYYPGKVWSQLVCYLLLIPVEVHGREKLHKRTSYVFVPNHQGAFDIFLIYGFLGRNFKWMMKKSLRKIPFVGKACESAGHIFVDRSSPKKVLATMRQAESSLKDGVSLVVFPEGARTFSGHMGYFKRGAFQLADELQLEVVPVTIDGSFEILPRTGKWIHRHRMILTIHTPIPPKGQGIENIKATLAEAYAAVESALPEKYKGMVKNEDQDR